MERRGLSVPYPCWLRCTPHRQSPLWGGSEMHTPPSASGEHQSESNAYWDAVGVRGYAGRGWSWHSIGWNLKDLMAVRGRWGNGVPLRARVARVMGSGKKAWYSLTVSLFLCTLFCASLHRCGDAPIPAVLVSSPLPFDDQHTRTDLQVQTVEKSPALPLVSVLLSFDASTHTHATT